MKLDENFITKTGKDGVMMVAADTDIFSGIFRGNATADFVLNLLKNETTREEIIAKVLEKYEVSEEQATNDVDRLLKALKQINAIA